MAFKIAGSMALKAAKDKCNPVLLEPIMKVEVTVPEEYMGDVMGDLNSRRGRIEGMDTRQARKSFVRRCLLPRCSVTPQHFVPVRKDAVVFSMELSHYEEVPKIDCGRNHREKQRRNNLYSWIGND